MIIALGSIMNGTYRSYEWRRKILSLHQVPFMRPKEMEKRKIEYRGRAGGLEN
jgi:hypothetical protein